MCAASIADNFLSTYLPQVFSLLNDASNIVIVSPSLSFTFLPICLPAFLLPCLSAYLLFRYLCLSALSLPYCEPLGCLYTCSLLTCLSANPPVRRLILPRFIAASSYVLLPSSSLLSSTDSALFEPSLSPGNERRVGTCTHTFTPSFV